MAKHGKNRLRKAGTVTAAAIAVSGAAAGWIGVAEASIPAANGRIYACYANKGGALRLINYPAQHCHSGETRISWNQRGPQGPRGARGPQGARGAQGAT